MSVPTDNIDYARTSNVTRMHAAVAREKSDPVAQGTPISLGVIASLIGITLIAGSYFGANMGTDSSAANLNGYDYTRHFDGVNAVGPQEMTQLEKHQPQNWIAIGQGIFSNNCSSCHQPHGNGLAGQYPPLNKSEFVTGGEERLAAILLHGVTGPLTVGGASVNGVMNPLGTTALNDTTLAQVLSYIRNAWDNHASVIYEDQIKEGKKKLGNRDSYTEAQLRALPADAALPKSEWVEKLQKAAAGGAAAPAPGAKPGTPPAPGAPAAPGAPPAPAPAPAAK
jgi:mono/diheme cytochrome c family protein